MEHEKLAQALNEISDSHIADASLEAKRSIRPWVSALAAVLAVAVLAAGILPSLLPSLQGGKDAALPEAPAEAPEAMDAYDNMSAADTPTTELPRTEEAAADEPAGIVPLAAPRYPVMTSIEEGNGPWRDSQRKQYNQPEGYADGTEDFFRQSIVTLLNSSSDNTVCSPLNVYMAMAMLAESTAGESRQEILDALGAGNIQDLRVQAGHVWNAHYREDGLSSLLFANSLWLSDTYSYNADAVNALAENYYASVYRGALGSDEMNQALQNWLNDQTRGLLEEQVRGMESARNSALSLASTVYYSAQWKAYFSADNTANAIFHGLQQDKEVLFMRTTFEGPYYRGSAFQTAGMALEDGSTMWLILPDEDVSTGQVLSDPELLDFLLGDSDSQTRTVELSLPKFDVVSQQDIRQALSSMGITRVSDPAAADFNSILPEGSGAYLSEASHAARVTIDETGVVAAAYVFMDAPTADIMPDIQIPVKFTLDRPFLFVIESADGLPMFAGVVNQP